MTQPPAKITKGQVRAIHVCLGAAGIDDETYRAMLTLKFSVTTCKDLTRKQAHQLLTQLRRDTGYPVKPKRKPRGPARKRQVDKKLTAKKGIAQDGSVFYLPTPRQHQFIHDLVNEIKWDSPDGYDRWRRGNLGIEKVRSRDDAQKVINGLKGLKRHGHSKTENRR